jgi:hypothetical protein
MDFRGIAVIIKYQDLSIKYQDRSNQSIKI